MQNSSFPLETFGPGKYQEKGGFTVFDILDKSLELISRVITSIPLFDRDASDLKLQNQSFEEEIRAVGDRITVQVEY